LGAATPHGHDERHVGYGECPEQQTHEQMARAQKYGGECNVQHGHYGSELHVALLVLSIARAVRAARRKGARCFGANVFVVSGVRRGT
jgi:hypothetical protein